VVLSVGATTTRPVSEDVFVLDVDEFHWGQLFWSMVEILARALGEASKDGDKGRWMELVVLGVYFFSCLNISFFIRLRDTLTGENEDFPAFFDEVFDRLSADSERIRILGQYDPWISISSLGRRIEVLVRLRVFIWLDERMDGLIMV